MSSKKVAKDIVQSSLIDIKPITDNQKIVFDSWKKDKRTKQRIRG